MGNVDFNALFNIGRQIAAMGGNREKIEAGIEKSTFDVAVNRAAAKSGVDASEIYSNTTIAELMGVEISQATPVETMDNTDAMFAMAGIKNPVENTARISTAAVVIDEIGIDEIDEISPSDEVTFAYIDQHQDGTAQRVSENATFVDEVASGDPELYEIASMMLYMA